MNQPDDGRMPWLYWLLVAIPCVLAVLYGLFVFSGLLPVALPDTFGTLGDSFGALNALFSGLAFAGVIITILLQREELSLQRRELRESRREFSRTASAQEQTARLVALAELLAEYRQKLAITDPGAFPLRLTSQEREDLLIRKSQIVDELEAILSSKSRAANPSVR